jgi:hypothetical protein
MALKDKDGKKASRKEIVADAQAMIDSAPSTGRAYLKLHEGLILFEPEARKDPYRLIFLPWKAGKLNRSRMENGYAINRFIEVHRNIDPEGTAFLCPYKTRGTACAVCDEFQKRQRVQPRDMGEEERKKYWKNELSPFKFQNRELFLIHDLDGEEENLQVWDVATFNFGDHLREAVSMKPAYKLYASTHKGLVVLVKGKKVAIGSGTNVIYGTVQFEKREENPLPDWMLDAIEKYSIDDCLVETPNSKLKMLLGAAVAEEDGETEEDLESSDTDQEPDDVEESGDDDEETERGEESSEEEESEEESSEEAENEEESEEPEPPKRRRK